VLSDVETPEFGPHASVGKAVGPKRFRLKVREPGGRCGPIPVEKAKSKDRVFPGWCVIAASFARLKNAFSDTGGLSVWEDLDESA
jgi:hypothetical protein